MRGPHGLVLAAVLCTTVCACATVDRPRADRPAERVVAVDTRFPGRIEPTPLAPAADVADVAELAELAVDHGGGLDGGIDVDALRAADRLDVSLPSITVAFTGDTLVHSPLVRRALVWGGGDHYDFAPMFAAVAPVISAADLAVCHLETPIAPDGEELSTYPRYGVPVEVAGGLASAGYDRCSTASNHSLDRGLAGIDATVAGLARYGLGESGMATSAETATPAIVHVGGIAIGHLSYSYGFNGLRFPTEEPWRTNEIDPARIIADAQDARVRGAQVVIVSLHWGDEGRSTVSDFQREVAEQLTASGAVDIIVGHHAHVIQPIEMVNGRWVMFGLGNFLSNMPVEARWPAATQDGVIVELMITQLPDGTFAIGTPVALPTWVDKNNGYVIRPVLSTLEDPTTSDGMRAILYASLLRTRAVLAAFIPGM